MWTNYRLVRRSAQTYKALYFVCKVDISWETSCVGVPNQADIHCILLVCLTMWQLVYLNLCREYLLLIQDHVTSKSKNETKGRVTGQEYQAPDQKLSANRDGRIRRKEGTMKERNLRITKHVRASRNRLTWKFTCEKEIILKNVEGKRDLFVGKVNRKVNRNKGYWIFKGNTRVKFLVIFSTKLWNGAQLRKVPRICTIWTDMNLPKLLFHFQPRAGFFLFLSPFSFLESHKRFTFVYFHSSYYISFTLQYSKHNCRVKYIGQIIIILQQVQEI